MSKLSIRENRTPPGGVCHDLWGAEFVGSPCHNRQVKHSKSVHNILNYNTCNLTILK